MLTVTDQKPQK